ncbi:MAG: 4Fe-4S binding protein [Bacteroidales bacterium]|jgi:ferredoxin|nr:4Fe-4S binding protein [Bacteroidales bacterium]
MKPSKIRQILAVVCFLTVTALFLDFTGSVHKYLSWITIIQFIPALLMLNVGIILFLVVLTFIFGRIYCSAICPLGILQDIISRIAAKRKKHRFSYSPALSWIRYIVLGMFVIAFVAGLHSFVALLDPYSAYGRIASNLFAPFYQWGNNVLAYLAERTESYAFYSTEIWLKSVLILGIAVATLATLIVLAWRNGRTYCNTICPVGTILGFISRFSVLKPVIDTDKCNACRSCVRNCKASCINEKENKIDYSRCVVCLNCINVCKQNAIDYRFKSFGLSLSKTNSEQGVSRRSFLTVFISFVGWALAKAQAPQLKGDGGLAKIIDKQPPKRTTVILPAGSQNARHFAKHCTGCQLCVSICPNQVLRPSKDLITAMQPFMSFEKGYCRPECTKCAEVCPTDAIHHITKAEKSSTQIGHAVWSKERCIIYTDKSVCDNCARHCPAAAITMIDIPELAKQETADKPQRPSNEAPKPTKIPVIDTERCIGCGACEHLCPARPYSAIFVEGHLSHRTV